MALVRMISEDEATDKVKEIYEEIKSTLRIDFVPNMYKVMALNPDYLDVNWKKTNSVMSRPGKLEKLTREIIAVTVSAVNSCQY